MADFNLFEIAGSIAGIAGVSLVVFYFLIRAMIKEPAFFQDLTPKAKRTIIILMLFMVWTITIFGMTSWIYLSSKSDGGQQPIKDAKQVELPDSLQGYWNAPAVRPQFTHFRLPGQDTSRCNLNIRSYLWLSFNPELPYFRCFDQDKICVKLLDVKEDSGHAVFELEVERSPRMKELFPLQLSKNESFTFEYKNCSFQFLYLGYAADKTGLRYWFRTRYTAYFEIRPERVE